MEYESPNQIRLRLGHQCKGQTYQYLKTKYSQDKPLIIRPPAIEALIAAMG